MLRHDFVYYDDPKYVTENPIVSAGFSWRGLIWAFKTGTDANWFPLTWFTHMLDVQLYGMNAGGHHLTNLLLHIANTLLLFGALYRMTGASGRSARGRIVRCSSASRGVRSLGGGTERPAEHAVLDVDHAGAGDRTRSGGKPGDG
ncbi:MAG: hypothetical protein ABI681_04585 [Gemmatimonadales bacterium]